MQLAKLLLLMYGWKLTLAGWLLLPYPYSISIRPTFHTIAIVKKGLHPACQAYTPSPIYPIFRFAPGGSTLHYYPYRLSLPNRLSLSKRLSLPIG